MKRAAVMLPRESQVPTEGWPAFRASLTGLARMQVSVLGRSLYRVNLHSSAGEEEEVGASSSFPAVSFSRCAARLPRARPRLRRESADLRILGTSDVRAGSDGQESRSWPFS